MNGKTLKIRRRLSIVALAASIAAIAIPAASAGGGNQAGLVASKLGSPDPRDMVQKTQIFTPSVIDRLVGSPDPRDSAASGLNEPSMNEVHLYPGGVEDKSLSTNNDVNVKIYSEAAQEHGSSGFLNQKNSLLQMIQDAAQEHGAAGFGNVSAS